MLLKNDQVLPLDAKSQVLVVGSGADDIQKQTGGWSLTWQGNENVLEKDFPGATTVLSATRQLLGDDRVVTDIDRAGPDTVALVVIGEDPYAEMLGDIGKTKTLEYSELKRSYRKDLQLIRELRARGHRVVTVFYSGRPLYVNEELTLSDAFVAAWLPGTEATGITDLLFSDGTHDFTGRLPYSWPANKCDNTINSIPAHLVHLPVPGFEQTRADGHRPLFPLGYGLSLDEDRSDRFGVDTDSIALDTRDYGCGMPEPDQTIATEPLDLFGHTASDDFGMYIGGTSTDWRGVPVSGARSPRSTVSDHADRPPPPAGRGPGRVRGQESGTGLPEHPRWGAVGPQALPERGRLDRVRARDRYRATGPSLARDALRVALYRQGRPRGLPAGAVGRRWLGNGHGPAGRSRGVRDGLRVRHDPVPDLRRYTADDKDRAGPAGALADGRIYAHQSPSDTGQGMMVGALWRAHMHRGPAADPISRPVFVSPRPRSRRPWTQSRRHGSRRRIRYHVIDPDQEIVVTVSGSLEPDFLRVIDQPRGPGGDNRDDVLPGPGHGRHRLALCQDSDRPPVELHLLPR